MRHALISMLLMMAIALGSCSGSKQAKPKALEVHPSASEAHVLAQHKEANPFADLSLDDIRNNREFFDTEIATGDRATQKNDRRQMLSDEHEARLIDIAIPFGVQFLEQYADSESADNEKVLGYITRMSVTELVGFYTEQMERLGWSCACHVRGYEQLLLFERPDRLCAIVIRSASGAQQGDMPLTKIVVFMSPKS